MIVMVWVSWGLCEVMTTTKGRSNGGLIDKLDQLERVMLAIASTVACTMYIISGFRIDYVHEH